MQYTGSSIFIVACPGPTYSKRHNPSPSTPPTVKPGPGGIKRRKKHCSCLGQIRGPLPWSDGTLCSGLLWLPPSSPLTCTGLLEASKYCVDNGFPLVSTIILISCVDRFYLIFFFKSSHVETHWVGESPGKIQVGRSFLSPSKDAHPPE